MNAAPVFISMGDVVEMTSLSRTAINVYRAAGKFPAAVQLTNKRIGFVRSEVERWILGRIEARDLDKREVA